MTDHMFSKDSWHYRLATVYQFDVFSEPKEDICGYTRQVIYGMFTASAITIFGAFFIWCLLNPIIWLMLPKGVYQTTDNTAFAVGMALYIIAFLLVCLYIVSEKIHPYLKEHTTWLDKKNEPGFVSQAYSSWKDKMCYKITFYDPTQGGTESPPDDEEDEDDDFRTEDELDYDIIKHYVSVDEYLK